MELVRRGYLQLRMNQMREKAKISESKKVQLKKENNKEKKRKTKGRGGGSLGNWGGRGFSGFQLI